MMLNVMMENNDCRSDVSPESSHGSASQGPSSVCSADERKRTRNSDPDSGGRTACITREDNTQTSSLEPHKLVYKSFV